MKIIHILMDKRMKRLCLPCRRKINLCVFSVLACIVFGYIVMMDVLQQRLRSAPIAVQFDERASDTEKTITYSFEPFEKPVYVESYCKRRNQNKLIEQKIQDMGFLQKPVKQDTEQICIHPELDPCDPSVAEYDKGVHKVRCSIDENWVYVDNGVFRISGEAIKKYGKITCECAPIVRGKGDYSARHAEHIKPMLDGTPLTTDFFKVACMSSQGNRYHNIHAGVAYNKTLHTRSTETPLPKTALGYDVFMLGFDSTSKMSWIRNLPKTREFFLNTLGGMELDGYNIVGDGTVQALLPILTGNTEHDLPSARRDNKDSIEVDHFPWIWNWFKEIGYVTAWAEDMSYIGTFQMRLKGFKHQPTDHSMRTYFMMAEPMYRRFSRFCIGSEPRHVRFLNWFRDLHHMYGNKPKFMFGFHSEYSHENNNELKKLDEDLANLLKHLHSEGFMNRTILILMGDHGSRFSGLRGTAQGKIEERMPYFAFHFPPDFIKSHPKAIDNFKINTKRLTTPFDIHETFHDIIHFRENRVDHTKGRGVSLFKEVLKNRTCESSEIEPHWCACLEWMVISDNDTSNTVGSSVVGFINNLTSSIRDLCAELTLSSVLSLSKFSPNSEVLKFRKSTDKHGDLPDMSDNMTLDYDYYQVTIFTHPGNGQFEVTVKHSIDTNVFLVNEKEISRINPYGNAPSCITNTNPNLRPFCYCTHQ